MWLLGDEYFFNHVENGLDIYNKFYNKYIHVEDFNTKELDPCLSQSLRNERQKYRQVTYLF